MIEVDEPGRIRAFHYLEGELLHSYVQDLSTHEYKAVLLTAQKLDAIKDYMRIAFSNYINN